MAFTVTDSGGSGSGPSVASLSLMNADTNQPIAGYDPLPNGATLDLTTLPTSNLNIRANTSPATIGSVRFALDGNSDYATETFLPYALAGDSSGNYNAWTPAVGSHSLTVTPYSGARATGTAGPPLTVAFTVTKSGGTSPQAVSSLSLINADTNQPISGYDPLPGGTTLDLATLPTRNLNIRANTSPATVGSVRFALDGNSTYATDSATPYALAGDSSGNYTAWTPAVGGHSVTATPYTGAGAAGTAGTPLTVAFTVTDSGASTPQAVSSLSLINADTNQPIAGYDPLPGGTTLDLATLPTRNLNIRANTSPTTVGSVRFALDGNSTYATDSAPPYALAGDSSGNYTAWTPSVGGHSVTATPYTGAGATGTAGTPLTVAFTVTDSGGSSSGPSVASLSLMNADTNQPIAGYDPLPNGATLDLTTLPTSNLNIRANTSPTTVGSVRFALDGNSAYRTETAPPYALAGDTTATTGRGPPRSARTASPSRPLAVPAAREPPAPRSPSFSRSPTGASAASPRLCAAPAG